MGHGSWNAKGLSPFLSERARNRAPQILSYAAVTGAAMLVSPSGEVALFSGAAPEVDVTRIARVAQARCGTSAVASFPWGSICVHSVPVSMGWVLCVLSTGGASPGHVIERARRASAVLALALADSGVPNAGGGDGSPGSGAPAEVLAARLAERKN
jgi:hypothetical protein